MAEEKKYEYVLPKGTALRSSEGEYIIKRVLGQGGYGITYQASGRRAGDNVVHKYAIKEFFVKGQCWRDEGNCHMKFSPAAKQDVKESLKDFKDEAVRLNKICRGNRNIVNVNEVFEANGTAYYVMEYLEGGNLRDKVREHGRGFSEGVALSYIRPIAEAVEFIHSQHNLLHCDIKPENIMLRLDEEGQQLEPVLIDFGISVHFNKKGELTTTHNSMGVSHGYSPQEQYQGLHVILEDRKRRYKEGYTDIPLIPFEMDVYALGATLFHLITGTKPAQASYGLESIINKKLIECKVSEKTRDVIVNAMRQDNRNRTKTAAAFLKGFDDRYYLPKWFVLRSPNIAYQIVTDLQEETTTYLKYGAFIYTGQQQIGNGNETLRQRYDVYEYFVQGLHHRQKDESLSANVMSSGKQQLEKFLSVVELKTGFPEIGMSEKNEMGMVVREVFNANGTIYAVVKQGWKPESVVVQILNRCKNTILANGRQMLKVASIVGGISLLGCGGYYAIDAISQYMEARRAENEEQSKLLTHAISTNNKAMLIKFANADSVRAYLPLASIYLNDNDTVNARLFAEKSLAENGEDKTAQDIIAKIVEMNVPVAVETPFITPAKEGSDAIAKEEARKKAEELRKEEERKKKEAAKQEAAKQQEKPQVASKEETQAEAAKKALQYVNGARTYENHQKAYQWAQKADPETKAKVIQRLKDMDFPIP